MSMIDTPLMRGLERVLDRSSFRQQLISTNLANVDTPGYRTRDLGRFSGELQQAMTQAMDTTGEEAPAFPAVARAVPNLLERPDGNNVSVERESLLMAQNQLHFQVAVAFLKAEFHRLSLAINGGSSS
ncbi:MAG: flagellar basal body rod protein FlgB [Terriglobales bacterium]